MLLALLRTLWRLSYQEVHDWLYTWPALARACGLPLGIDGQLRSPRLDPLPTAVLAHVWEGMEI